MHIPTNKTYIRAALVGGGITAAVLGASWLIVGQASGATPMELMDSALPTIRFLASAVATSAATTLALILTLLGLSASADLKLDAAFYRQMRRVAQLDVATFIASILLLIVLVMPLRADGGLSSTFYTVAYYTLSAAAAVTAGLLVSVVLALYGAVHDLIETFWLGEDVLIDEDAEGKKAEVAEKAEADHARERADEKVSSAA